ncbi:MAG: hypothetical protein ACKOQ8_02240 [Micrococcales bacterium]
MTPIKHGKQWLVAPDETSRIYQFDTEEGARKWISDNGADSSVATQEFKAKPIIDTAPSQFDSIVEAAAKTAPDPTAAKDIMKRVAEADSLAKETNGIRAGLSTHAAQINYLLNPERLQAKLEARLSLNGNKLISAKNARLHIEEALGKNDVNAAVDYLRRNFPAAANEILSMSIKGDKGPVPIGKILSTNAISLNRLPAEAITQLRAAINNIIAPEAANAVREGLRNDLNRLLGSEEDSSKLVAAVFGKRDQKAIDEVLATIQSPTTQVKYTGISDLISGLRSGHQVDPKQVMKIAKLLSPEAYDWSKVSKNLDDGDTVNGLIGTIIKNGGGAQTMATTMERLSLLDSGQLAAATGISASDVLATALDKFARGEGDTAGLVTRDAADAFIAQIENNVNFLADRSVLKSVSDFLAKATSKRFGTIYDAAKSGTLIERQSVLGQAVAELPDAAILPQDFTASYEVNYLGALFQSMGAAMGKKIKAAENAGEVFQNDLNQIDKFIRHYDVMENYLVSTQGVRISHQRALLNYIHGADKTKLGKDHYWAYINMGDVAQVLKQSGREDLFLRAFFPEGTVKGEISRASDWLSPYGIGEAVITLMESKEKGIPFDIKDIAALVKSQAKNQKGWTKPYAKQVDDLADQMAKVLAENVDFFNKAHQARMLASVGDAYIPAQTLSAELVGITLDAIALQRNAGKLSNTVYQETARDLFYKFVVATDAMNRSSGRVAESVMRQQARYFMNLLELRPILDEAADTGAAMEIKALSLINQTPESRAAYEEILRHINTFFDKKDPTAKLMALTTGPREEKLTQALYEAETALEAHIKSFPDVVDEVTQKAFSKTYKTLLAKLDKARAAALKVGIQTRHWKLGEVTPEGVQTIEWVNRGVYDHAEVEKQILDTAGAQKVIQRSKGKKTDVPVDSKPDYGVMKQASERYSKSLRTQFQKRANEHNLQRAENHIAQASDNAIQQLPQFLQAHPESPLAGLYASLAAHYESTMKADSIDITWETIQQNIERSLAPEQMIFGGTYKDAQRIMGNAKKTRKAEETAIREGRTKFSALSERISATRKRGQIGAEFNATEVAIMRGVSSTAGAFEKMISFYEKRLSPKEMTKAINFGLRNMSEALPTKAAQGLAKSIYVMSQATTDLLKDAALTSDTLVAALRKRGIGDEYGVNMLKEMRPDEIHSNFWSWLPFGEKPNDLSDEVWRERTAGFEKRARENKGLDEIQMLARIMDAIQFEAGTQKLAFDLVKRHNWRAMGYTSRAAALADGFVSIKQVNGEAMDFNRYFPMDSEENLFHPEVAKNIAASIRAWNHTYSGNMAPWMGVMMQILSVFKATQTVLRPGHLIANTIGDMSIALMDGTTPADLAAGMALAARYAKQQVNADWLKDPEQAIVRQIGAIARINDAGYVLGDKGYELVVNGKKVHLEAEQLNNLLEDANVHVRDQVTNDTDGLRWKFEAEAGGTAADKQYRNAMLGLIDKSAMSRVAQGWQKFVKPAGDLNAYVGNGIRAAHALKVMRSRNWSSLEELRNAMNEMINTYHPTIQSLSASERKSPRMIFSYYTWLRGAHTAFFELMTNHTAAMLIPSKVFYNQAQTTDQEGAYSLGNLWGDKTKTPGYLNYSTYGPTLNGPRGPMLYKPSILPLDVLDTWNVQFDPTKSADVQVIDNAKSVMRTVASSINMVAQPGIEAITGVDLKTGNKSTVKDLPTAMDKLASNVGFMQILQGIGAYTPSNKGPDAANPLTQRDRDLKTINWWTGGKFADTTKPSDIKNAKTEANARQKRISDIIASQTKGK